MPEPITMNQFYLHIVERHPKINPRINTITTARALHWGVVGALLSARDSERFSTELLDTVVKRYQDAAVDVRATNGLGQLAIGEYFWKTGASSTPYLGFEGSDLYFGLTPDGLPDFDIASMRS